MVFKLRDQALGGTRYRLRASRVYGDLLVRSPVHRQALARVQKLIYFLCGLACGLALAVVTQARAQEVYAAADVFDAIDSTSVELGISWTRLYSIVRCETGGTLAPYSIGRAGERGVAQLHPRGELATFYQRGYRDPFNPWEAVHFLGERLLEGGARAWSCAR